MLLAWLILIPVIGGLAAWLSGRQGGLWPRWISLAALVLDGVLLVLSLPSAGAPLSGPWFAELILPWIPALGISIHLAMDGLSLVLVALTLFLGILAVACSWTEVQERIGFFHANILFILAGIIGVFLALDLFLFVFFWELMLVPMYFLISIWGHENRRYASLKFFIFTQAGGLFMLLSVLALSFIHGNASGTYTFDYPQLLGTRLSPPASLLIALGFLLAFLVKLPAVPFHPWLADAHTEAPTAGSVILAGLMLKTGAYGMLRFVLPLFPEPARILAPAMLVLGVLGILYGAFLAFSQTDLKRLVAYTSVSHMGFVLLGIFGWTRLSLQGAVMQMVAHGVSTGALFIIVGLLQERLHTRDLDSMGGLWSAVPRMSGMAMVFALASLGLPGFANFVAEFLVLSGAFPVAPVLTALAAIGLVLAAAYSLRMVDRAFQGEPRDLPSVPDLSLRETGILAVMTIVIFWLGLHPQPVLNASRPVLNNLQYIAPCVDRIDADTRPGRQAEPAVSVNRTAP